MNRNLEFAKELAAEAGGIMRQYFLSAHQGIIWKADKTPLTIADTQINQLVVDRVAKEFPDHSVIGEEASNIKTSEYAWVCDPIDGTFPFSHGIPVSSFNLALVHNGIVEVAVINDPFSDRLYSAVRGEGAFLNGIKLRISEPTGSRLGVSVEGWGGSASIFSEAQKDVEYEFQKALRKRDKYVCLYHCSVAYTGALVASSDLAGVVFSGTNPWDSAAMSLIIEEAGGVVTDFFGNDQRYDQETKGLIAGPPKQHAILLGIAKQIVDKYL